MHSAHGSRDRNSSVIQTHAGRKQLLAALSLGTNGNNVVSGGNSFGDLDLIAGPRRPLHHHDSIGAGRRWGTSHDSGSLSRFVLDLTILDLVAGSDFSD